jgi:hypothetical protein
MRAEQHQWVGAGTNAGDARQRGVTGPYDLGLAVETEAEDA